MPRGTRATAELGLCGERRPTRACAASVIALLVALLVVPVPALAGTSQEIRVHWQAYAAAPPQVDTAGPAHAASNVFHVVARKTLPQVGPRQRAPELSSEQLLVEAVDAGGQPRGWTLIADPRILRAEGPDESGRLSGTVLHHSTVEFLVTLPDDPAMAELRFYHPRWTGAGFVLDLLGTTPLR